MKRLFFITIVALSLVFCACVSDPPPPPEQPKQLNISILLDLSDRINPTINPDAQKNDIENIKTITEFFKANMESLGAYKAKGKIRVFLVPPPSNLEINSIVNKLKIDCSKMDNKGRKEVYDNLTELYTQNLDATYKETIATSAWIGSDIWRFFKDDVKDYCVENNSDYRNILIILTDGYLYHEQSKYNTANRFTYLLNSNLANYRKQNWKQLVEQKDFGIMTERNDLNDLEILVLEIKAENSSNRIDEDILLFVLEKWFDEMNVSRHKAYRSDLPANTKIRIENFLENLKK